LKRIVEALLTLRKGKTYCLYHKCGRKGFAPSPNALTQL
jgi:hypothetical protein